MVIKPTNLDECDSNSKQKQDIEEPPTPMRVPIQKIGNYSVDIIGEMMSNTLLGLYSYPMFSTYPIWLGISFITELDQYVIIITSRNKGDWEKENIADLVTDEMALEMIVKQGKTELLEGPEFKRLNELYNHDPTRFMKNLNEILDENKEGFERLSKS